MLTMDDPYVKHDMTFNEAVVTFRRYLPPATLVRTDPVHHVSCDTLTFTESWGQLEATLRQDH